MRATSAAAVVATAALLAGCSIPADSEGTLERVRSEGVLRVGVTERPPWAEVGPDGAVGGVEARLVEAWAAELEAEITWVIGSETQIAAALEGYELDLAIGGYTTDAPSVARLGTSQPYVTTAVEIMVSPGASQDGDWEDVPVAHPVNRPDFAALIAEAGAEPRPVAEPSPPVALYGFEADGAGLTPSGTELGEEAHVIAVPPGEGAMALALDRFLAEARRDGRLAAALAEGGR